MNILIGLDVGTTNIKAVATDLNNNIIAEYSKKTNWNVNNENTDVDMFSLAYQAIAVAEEAAKLSMGTVVGIGITGFAETGVLISNEDKVLSFGLAWHDKRAILEPILEAINEKEFRSTTGLSVNPTISLAKTLWINKNINNKEKVKYFMSTPEWIAYCLGAEIVNEMSLLSRTGFFDIINRKPWAKSIELVSDNKDFLGKIVVAGEPIGLVSSRYSTLVGATITIAGHDHLTAAYYSDAIKDEVLFDSIGTAEAFLRTVEGNLDPDTVHELSLSNIGVSCSVIDNHYTLLGVTNTGLTLEKFFSSLENLNKHKSEIELLIKYLVANSNPIIKIIESFVGKSKKVIAAGGWIKNPIMLEEKRNQFKDRDFSVSFVSEPGAMGAAKFAGVAVRKNL